MREERYFVFPMNYNKKESFLGFIDYRALVLIGVTAFIIFSLLKLIDLNLKVKVCIFIIFCGMPVILLLIGINGENMVDFLKYVFRFLVKDKVYVYRKSED